MPNNITSFFHKKLRTMPTETDIELVSTIINELREKIVIPPTGHFSFSPVQEAFVVSLVNSLISAYTAYRFTECGGRLYRAFRENRATWNHAALENGPKLAESRMSRDYWLKVGEIGRIDADVRDRVAAELETQLLAPLETALRDGIPQGSRLEYLLQYLKDGIERKDVYSTLEESRKALESAKAADEDARWCSALGLV